MSQLSIARRLDRLLDALLPPYSPERAEHDLPDDLREALAAHRARCARIIEDAEIAGQPGDAFAMMLDGSLATPEMPEPLKRALNVVAAPVITTDMTLDEAARVYCDYAQGSRR